MAGTILSRKEKTITAFFLGLYLLLILYFTVIDRSTTLPNAQLQLLWSYKKWVAGNWTMGWEIIANILMFVPVGFLFSALINNSRRHLFVKTIAFGMVNSAIIELLQLFLFRGLFEFDDLISNTLGAFIGGVIFVSIKKCCSLKIYTLISIIIGIGCCSGIIYVICTAGEDADASSQLYCFQVDEVTDNYIYGFTFQYEKQPQDYSLFLISTRSGNKYAIPIKRYLYRADVNNYFNCEYDYSYTGFRADISQINKNDEYEVFISWGWPRAISTGVYIKNGDIRYITEKEKLVDRFKNTDVEEIAENGEIRVYRPDKGCYVFQQAGELYWVADENFKFDDDKSTEIQFQIWTSQVDKLPSSRREMGVTWDNLTAPFEENEITGNFGRYRVCKRTIPKEYSVISILTGCYKNGRWYWQNNFRPVYNSTLID